MFTAPLSSTPSAQGLFIAHCPSVHGFFMRYALDVVYLASERTSRMPNHSATSYLVTHISHLKPWGFSVGKRWLPPVGSGQLQWLRSQHALELPAGTVASLGIAPGDRLEWRA